MAQQLIRGQPTHATLESAWSDYLVWLGFAVPGMLNRGNVDAMAHAIRRLPSEAPLVEIGSFCGLSTCVLSYLCTKHGRRNPLFTCDRWAFEGQELGKPLGDSSTVTHDAYRTFVRESFLRNARTFCQDRLPHTIEADSDEFFARWRESQRCVDVFGTTVRLGGPIAFAYIDGNHTYEFARRDFDNVDRHLEIGGHILFDDSADGSAWEVCRVIDEILRSDSYAVVAKMPNYLVQKVR
ncbi:MAG: class I SAM-dependent methyltransferase [Phycisphaerales bacterium]